MSVLTETFADRAATLTVESATPRATAMDYARHLIRRDGVRLGAINYRRAGDGAILVGADGHATLRFVVPGFDRR